MARRISDGVWGADNFEPSGDEVALYEAVKAGVRARRSARKCRIKQDTQPMAVPRIYRYLGPKVKEMWISDYNAIRSRGGDI